MLSNVASMVAVCSIMKAITFLLETWLSRSNRASNARAFITTSAGMDNTVSTWRRAAAETLA